MLASAAPIVGGRVDRRMFLGGLAACCATAIGSLSSAAKPQSESGTSSRDARDDATRQLPLKYLSQRDRQRVMSVVNDAAIYRRMPTQTIVCDRGMYNFSIDNPDLIVNMWRVLGISDVSLRRTGPATFKTNDGAGTVGGIELLYQSPEVTLALADGSYEGALFSRRLMGNCVMLLTSEYGSDATARQVVRCRMDSFIQIENVGAELVARTFQPVVGHYADHNFRETANFIAMLSRAAEVNPSRVLSIAGKLNDVPSEVRGQFVELTQNLASRVAAAEEPVDVRPPELARRPMADAAVRP